MLLDQKKLTAALLCGLLGCLCFGAGDWLMLYGDTAHNGALTWLTVGAAQIAPWRNNLAMALAFPGIIFYAAALFAMAALLSDERDREVSGAHRIQLDPLAVSAPVLHHDSVWFSVDVQERLFLRSPAGR